MNAASRKFNANSIIFFAVIAVSILPQFAGAAATNSQTPVQIPVPIPPEAVAPLGTLAQNPALFDVFSEALQPNGGISSIIIAVIAGIVLAVFVLLLVQTRRRPMGSGKTRDMAKPSSGQKNAKKQWR